MEVSTRRLTADVTHPKDSGLRVTIRHLDFFESVELEEAKNRAEIRETLIDPRTGEPMKEVQPDKTTRYVSQGTGRFPVRFILEALEQVVVGVSGLKDKETGESLIFGPTREQRLSLLRHFMQPELAIDLAKPTPTGQTKELFGNHIFGKVFDPATFGITEGKA